MNKRILNELATIFVGTLISTLGFKYFVLPLYLNQAGLSGIALLLTKIKQTNLETVINVNQFNFWFLLLNIPLIIWGYFKLGKKFIIYTIINIIIFTAMIKYLPNLSLFEIGSNKLLATIVGAYITGLGFAAIFKAGGSTGGTDLISVYITKVKPKIPIAKINFSINTFIILVSQLILSFKFNVSFFSETLFYTIVYFAILKIVIDTMFPRHNIIKVSIITTQKTQVTKLIKEFFPHKAYSSFEVQGTRGNKNNINIILSYYEARELISLISKHKIKAFSYTTRLYNVHGSFVSKK